MERGSGGHLLPWKTASRTASNHSAVACPPLPIPCLSFPYALFVARDDKMPWKSKISYLLAEKSQPRYHVGLSLPTPPHNHRRHILRPDQCTPPLSDPLTRLQSTTKHARVNCRACNYQYEAYPHLRAYVYRSYCHLRMDPAHPFIVNSQTHKGGKAQSDLSEEAATARHDPIICDRQPALSIVH